MEQNLYDTFLSQVETRISCYIKPVPPYSVYDPFHYVITAGGKRIRPVMAMLCAGAVGGNPSDALDAAVAIEILHNFTLVHDDIMDKSLFRRGKPTVHIKWNEATAILSGDVMVGWAYKLLMSYQSKKRFPNIIDVFTNGLIEVCEGQAYDMDFNESADVTVEDYINMIDKKTAKILQTAALLGALSVDCSEMEVKAISDFAYNFGLAFQLQDDLLDISAEQEKLGKKIGQDILEGKKTYLILMAKKLAQKPEQKRLINQFYQNNGLSEEYIPKMKSLFEELGILELTYKKSKEYLERSSQCLESLRESEYRDELKKLVLKMGDRKF